MPLLPAAHPGCLGDLAMRNRLLLFFWCAALCAATLSAAALPASVDAVRPPAVAGAFYPADGTELVQMVDGFLAKVPADPIKDLVALVSPHAGYPFSGHVAAYSYAQLKGRPIERVVVIAPSHYDPFTFVSIFDGAAYSTPLGRVPIDQAFSRKLAAASPLLKLSDRGHKPAGEWREHALEVQLPFLQRVLGHFELVAIIMGNQDYDSCRALGLALAKLITGPGTMIIASSDLSHYHTYDQAVRLDRKTLGAIQEWDYLAMSRNFAQDIWEACGGGPIIAAMIAAERLGAHRAQVLKYANSGDVTPDRSRVVGYGAVAFSRAPAAAAAVPRFDLAPEERAELLRIARASVETVVKERKEYQLPAAKFEALSRERGVFVTLKKHGDLRGCIGYVSPLKPLDHAVRDVAAFAAVRDQRFRPVMPAELPELSYEISVLSPMRRVLDVQQIRPGRDGLLVRRDGSEGLLLPQVATEEGWDRTRFLEETCVKAGLMPQTWRDDLTDIFSFTALVFGDRERPRPPEPRSPQTSARQF